MYISEVAKTWRRTNFLLLIGANRGFFISIGLTLRLDIAMYFQLTFLYIFKYTVDSQLGWQVTRPK